MKHITGKLKVGDIIQVHNALLKKEHSFYRITKVEGNKAFSGFRTFNRNVYFGSIVYEHGKKIGAWDNGYSVSNEQEAHGYNAEVK